MIENRFDLALQTVSRANGLDWTDASAVQLFARFLSEQNADLFPAWERFLECQAAEELDEEHSLSEQDEEEEEEETDDDDDS